MNNKIVLVIPSLASGGAERVMSELANIWSSQGYEVHLILLGDLEIFYKVNKNVKIHRMGFVNKSFIQKPISEFIVFFNLRKLLRKLSPIFILSFMIKYNIFVLLSNLFLNNKIFVSDRDNPSEKLPILLSVFHKYIYRIADGIIVQTEISKRILKLKIKHKNITAIPNPIKNIHLNDAVKKQKIILNVGRLVEKKGQKYLLEAFAKIPINDWKLVIIGDGHLREVLEEYSISLGIKDRVEILGTVKNVDYWMNKSSIFAFPSIYEGFPNALAEAMAVGLPCISFDCPTGPSEMIENNHNGILIPLHNIEQFTNNLYLLMKDPELRQNLSEEAKKISVKFDRVKIAHQYLEFCTKN